MYNFSEERREEKQLEQFSKRIWSTLFLRTLGFKVIPPYYFLYGPLVLKTSHPTGQWTVFACG